MRARSPFPIPFVLSLAAAAPLGAQAPRVAISEIHYHPAAGHAETAEFLELHNPGPTAVDVSGWVFTKGIEYAFPAESRIEPGGYRVLVADAAAYRAAFGAAARIDGVFAGRLDNDGEIVRLRTAPPGDAVAAEVRYGDLSPWPVAADGSGKSLELYDPAADGSDPFHWRAGGPTPGARNSVAGSPPGVRLAWARHEPLQPASADAVTVAVHADHPRPLARIEVKYQIGIREPAEILSAPLRDDGAGGDAVAGDGIYSAALPPRPNLTLVRYWFEAEDADGEKARLPDPLSPTANFGYYVLDGGVETAVPLYHLVMDPAQFAQLLTDSSDRLRSCALVHDGAVYDRIQIRQRGAFARSWPKKSFKVIFNRDRMFQGQKRINLNSGWRDPAFLRELIAYDLHRRAGALYSNVQVVRLHVNGAFHGCFLEVEQPTDEYLERQGLPGAVWYKADSPNNQSDERRFSQPADYVSHYQRETFSGEPHDDLHQFCVALASAARGDQNLQTLTALLDIDDFIDYLVANQFTSNWDAFNKNHYIGWDREGSGKWTMGPWDLDRTLGDHWDGSFNAFSLHILLGEAEHAGVTGWNRVFDRFYEHPELLQKYYDRLRKFLLEEFDEIEYGAWIDEVVARAGKDIDADRARWNSDITGLTWRNSVGTVKRYLADRKNFMLQSLPGTAPRQPAIVSPVDGERVEARRVRLRSSEFVSQSAGAAHFSTVWQVRLERGVWTAPLLETETRNDLTAIDFDALPETIYAARVAHRDTNGKISPFSADRFFSTSRFGLARVPFDLSSVFSADVVADPGDPENQPFEGSDSFLIADGFDGTGAANPAANGLPLDRIAGGYRLADYSGPNALQLKRGDAAPIEIAVPPGSYAAVRALVSGGAGDSQVVARLVYSDGGSEDGIIYSDDWEDDEVDDGPGGRLKPELRTIHNGMDALVAGALRDANEYGLFESVLPADPDRVLERLVLLPEQGASNPGTRYASSSARFHLFALEGLGAGSPGGGSFRRGEVDGSDGLAIADAVVILEHLFLGGAEPACPDAADADDNGRIEITDPIAILGFLFLGEAPPPDPGPSECGPDPTADDLVPCGPAPPCGG